MAVMGLMVHFLHYGETTSLCGIDAPSKHTIDKSKVTCGNCSKRVQVTHLSPRVRCKYCAKLLPRNKEYEGQMHVFCRAKYDKASKELSL